MTRQTTTQRILLFLAVALLLPISATEAQLTAVSPAGTDTTEGGLIVFPFQTPYPDFPEPGAGDRFRQQELTPASVFESLGPGPFSITGIAWRPDTSVNGPVSAEWEIVALNLSTTTRDADSMSTTFADNYGADGFEEVFSGTVQLQTDGIRQDAEMPHKFDYVFEFDRPYTYDPDQGNLLVEMIAAADFPANNDWIWTDGAEGEGVFAVFGLADSPEAFASFPLIIVTEFSVVPEPSTSFSAALGLVGLLAWRRKRT